MSATPPQLNTLRGRLIPFGQEHLLRFWVGLTGQEQATLASQIEQIDLERLARLWSDTGDDDPRNSPRSKAERAVAPTRLVAIDQSPSDRDRRMAARQQGEQLLREGRVGAILVAGGEGSRLGFPHPKGMFPIGPVSGKSLYQLLSEQLLERGRRAERPIPYCIMTSDATDVPTRDFFEQHRYFGLRPEDVFFFRQGVMPAVDRATGKILLKSRGELALNPDGHGGMLEALARSGCLQMLRDRGVDYLYYHQVDNPLARVCDPEFLGFHHLEGASVSTKAVAKQSAGEKMGALVEVDGRTEIIEYSDLPADLAARQTADGRLLFWAGSTAMHVFSRSVLERLSQAGSELPFHRAIKKVRHLNEAGVEVEPTSENAIKYERFIFDVLPLAGPGLVVEARRFDEFCPLKNQTGEFSADHVRQSLHALHARWLTDAGVEVGSAQPIEISPRRALAPEDLAGWKPALPVAAGPVYLDA